MLFIFQVLGSTDIGHFMFLEYCSLCVWFCDSTSIDMLVCFLMAFLLILIHLLLVLPGLEPVDGLIQDTKFSGHC